MPGMTSVVGQCSITPPARNIEALRAAEDLTVPGLFPCVSHYLKRSLLPRIAILDHTIFTDSPKTHAFPLEVVIILHYLTHSSNITHRSHKMSSLTRLSYGERADKHQHPVAKRFFETAEAKKSNLIVSADFTTTKELIECADSKY